MRRVPFVFRSIVPAIVLLWLVSPSARGESPNAKAKQPIAPASRSLSLVSYDFQEPTTKEKTTVTTRESSDNHWEISGPVFLRSADPEPPGEVVIKNIFEYGHTRKSAKVCDYDGDDNGDCSRKDRDEYEYELEIEWGIAENHELIFEVPFQLGEGSVDGNGDLTAGWHWRLWDEQGWIPAIALRNFVRLPTGIDSSGVDYEIRGLFTKTLVPGKMRLHFNPFAKSVNGDNDEDAEPFQYGVAIGADYRISDKLLFITDYIYSSEETESASRANHAAEFGVDWKIADHHKLGLVALVGLDGDAEGPSFGAKISYMISFGG